MAPDLVHARRQLVDLPLDIYNMDHLRETAKNGIFLVAWPLSGRATKKDRFLRPPLLYS